MTKTITEFQPLIYQQLLARPDQRRIRRHRLVQALTLGLPVLYIALGVKITADTGVAPWHWQFWLMFAPLFIAGERAIWALRERSPALQPVRVVND